MITEEEIRRALEDVKDPEIPLLSVIDMGIISKVSIDGRNNVEVTMTPTFAGCPAVEYMKSDIRTALSKLPVGDVDVKVDYDVQWSTNMITEKGRQQLKKSHFALPAKHDGLVQIEMLKDVECPFCGSSNTSLKSEFGPTQCRAIHYCNNCFQAFEQFKPV